MKCRPTNTEPGMYSDLASGNCGARGILPDAAERHDMCRNVKQMGGDNPFSPIFLFLCNIKDVFSRYRLWLAGETEP